jgi:hypothetical protein
MQYKIKQDISLILMKRNPTVRSPISNLTQIHPVGAQCVHAVRKNDYATVPDDDDDDYYYYDYDYDNHKAV